MNRDNKGFTLIELMLAMTFIAMLLVGIAMTVIQISNIYNRGLTLKDVNQAGRTLASELQRSVAVSPPFAINYPDPKSKFIKTMFNGNVIGGRLCIGQYSYIWNYGKNLAVNTESNKFTGLNPEKIRFVKAPDSAGEYCTYPESGISQAGAVEMLTAGDLDLAVHNFTIDSSSTATDPKTKQSLYYVSFVIGTNEQAALNAGATECNPPSDAASNLTYCSVNQFKIVVRTGNAVQ